MLLMIFYPLKFFVRNINLTRVSNSNNSRNYRGVHKKLSSSPSSTKVNLSQICTASCNFFMQVRQCGSKAPWSIWVFNEQEVQSLSWPTCATQSCRKWGDCDKVCRATGGPRSRRWKPHWLRWGSSPWREKTRIFGMSHLKLSLEWQPEASLNQRR